MSINVPIKGHVGGLGVIQHTEFAMAAGEMSSAEFAHFLKVTFANEARVSIDGALHYQFMDWRHVGEMMEAGESVYCDVMMEAGESVYCDVTIERWQTLIGKDAILTETGESFTKVKARREAELERLCDIALGIGEAA